MEIPAVIVNWILFVLLALVGVVFRTTLMGRMDRLDQKIIEVEKTSKEHETTINAAIERMSAKSDSNIDKIMSIFTPKIHCDAKQELWQAKFDAILVASAKEHKNLEHNIDGLGVIIKELGEYVHNLQAEGVLK